MNDPRIPGIHPAAASPPPLELHSSEDDLFAQGRDKSPSSNDEHSTPEAESGPGRTPGATHEVEQGSPTKTPEALERHLADDREWPRELVLASAGTGKTFWITSRLIGLLAYGAEPDQVLASTFTRKAAGEILHRTLDRLAEATLDDAKAAELTSHASLPHAPPIPGDRAFWSALLERTVRKLHRFNVGTLDSFFVRAARAFEQELEMPVGWRIAEESASRRLRSRVLQGVVTSMDRAEMTELLRLVNRGEARRSVHAHLLGLVDDLITVQQALDPDVDNPWTAFDRLVIGNPPPTLDECEALAAEVERFPLPVTARGLPNQPWRSAIDKLAEALRARDWTRVLENGLCKKHFNGEVLYSGHPLDLICPLLERARDAMRRSLKRSLADQAMALGDFTARFCTALDRAQTLEGLYRFDDVTRLLSGAEPIGDRADLYYRLDATTRHILLDEFQDISIAQWEALSPLVEEVLSMGGRAGVIVADSKQSIYGWRGAEPRLVRHVGEQYSLAPKPLHRSYRSSQIVLDLVNQVFEGIAESSILTKDNACARSTQAWSLDFARHETNKAGLPGFVSIEAGPRDTGSSRQRPLLCRRAAEKVAEIHNSAPGFSIGVLTRTNPTVARMILELRKLGLHASEEGGNPLTDSKACEAVLALIRLADHPGDTIAAYHVARSPVGQVVDFTDHTNALAAATTAGQLRRELLGEGYGGRLNRLARDLEPFCDDREHRRLMQLVELGYRHDLAGSLRPSEFVHLAETERIEDPVRARVRVMTVHQAKGLEFDAVVLPELDYPLYFPPKGPALPLRREPAGRVVAVYPFIKADFRFLFPEVDEAVAQGTAAAARDGLSNLYVALTRARYATYAVIAADDQSSGFKSNLTPACILRESLARGVPRPIADRDVIYTQGDPRWWASFRDSPSAEAAPVMADAMDLKDMERTDEVDAPRAARDPGNPGSAPDTAVDRIDGTFATPSDETSGSSARFGSSEAAAPRGMRSRAGGAESGPPVPQLELSFETPAPDHAASECHGQAPIAPGVSASPASSVGREAETAASNDMAGRIRFAARPRSRRLPRRTPSQLEGGSHVDVRYLLRLDTRAAMRRGSIMHAWLEQIAWLDEGVPTDSELHRIAMRIDPALESNDIESVLSEFRRSISHPTVRRALSRAAYPPSATPSREVRFLHREGETIVEGSIDRLVLIGGPIGIDSAEVIDFKTDLQTNSPAILADRVRYYRPQLAAYCRAVGAMYRLQPGAVSGKLIFLESGLVVPVDGSRPPAQ